MNGTHAVLTTWLEQPSVPTSPGGTPLPREDDEPDEPLPQLVRLHYNVETEDSAKR
jgi:hypothetical protein